MNPEIARNLNPNDPVQQALLQNFSKLSPQDLDVLKQGLSPPMLAVLGKIAPSVAFVFQKIASMQQQGGGQAPGMDQPGAGGGQPSAGAPPPGLPQSTTKLGQM